MNASNGCVWVLKFNARKTFELKGSNTQVKLYSQRKKKKTRVIYELKGVRNYNIQMEETSLIEIWWAFKLNGQTLYRNWITVNKISVQI